MILLDILTESFDFRRIYWTFLFFLLGLSCWCVSPLQSRSSGVNPVWMRLTCSFLRPVCACLLACFDHLQWKEAASPSLLIFPVQPPRWQFTIFLKGDIWPKRNPTATVSHLPLRIIQPMSCSVVLILVRSCVAVSLCSQVRVSL